jgi:hypothetical protein
MAWTPPPTCREGHPLRYPNVSVGWTPCGCPRAGTGTAGSPSGHQYAKCRTCGREYRENGCDELADGFRPKE